MKEWAPKEVDFYNNRYLSASKGNYDIYVVFVERGLFLLNPNGRLGFILPHKFFNAQYGESLRSIISKNLSRIVNFGYQQVFENATTYTCLMFLMKNQPTSFEYINVENIEEWKSTSYDKFSIIETKKLGNEEWVFGEKNNIDLFTKLDKFPIKLSDVTLRIFQGLKTSADKIFIVDELESSGNNVRVFSKEKSKEYILEKELLRPLIKGGNSKRYSLKSTSKLLIFPYWVKNEKEFGLISKQDMKLKYPKAWQYLLENKPYLENRENGRMVGDKWYGYIYPKNFYVLSLPKIFTPDLAYQSSFSIDENGHYLFTGGAAGGYGIIQKPEISRSYLLGILNSKLLEWFLHNFSTMMRGGWYSYESRYIHKLPIYLIDFSNPAEVKQHDHMVTLVERMLELHKRTPQTPHEKERLEREIASTDAQIDRLVYELYGLTEEEIRIVEGKTQN